ncbi:MAG: peptidoglycan DD-metalloendopeptidase family protein [Myxococcota bacterium]
MERYSLILVADETAPIRRFDFRKDRVKRAAQAAVVAVCLFLVGSVDYVRVRIDHGQLESLRAETVRQRDQIQRFTATLSQVESQLKRLSEFERKVRIIANLPGSAAIGGDDVIAAGESVGSSTASAARAPGDAPPAEAVAVPEDGAVAGEAGPDPRATAQPAASEGTAPDAGRVGALRLEAERLGVIADARKASLLDVLEKLESKRHHLASTPAIWPSKGWLTSRFGNRVSPFTGARQFHAGIDIAGERGTDVISPARGKVVFAGKRGPLGNSLIVDHGYGMRTIYGHAAELFVKRGDHVERGQVIATVGSSGRSTGPHLHYVVEVKGKAVDPLDYIFD